MFSATRIFTVLILLLALSAVCLVDEALARERIPAPPGKADSADLGGDDVNVYTMITAHNDDLAVTSDGDLLSAIAYFTSGDVCRIIVRRSSDGGTTWHTWGEFPDLPAGNEYKRPSIHVAEGDEDRCFIAYTVDTDHYTDELHVAWSPLDLETADFSNDTTIYVSGWDVYDPEITSDASSFDGYFVYVVFRTTEVTSGTDIFFVRSTDQGTSWEMPYAIGTIGVDDRGYNCPEIAIGFGGYVHVVWHLCFDDGNTYDCALRYRRASSYADGGLSSWDTIISLSSHTNDVHEVDPRIAASPVSSDVMVACERIIDEGDPDGINTLSSADAGETWGATTTFGDYHEWLGNLEYHESTDRWIMAVHADFASGVRWAPAADPSSWSENQVFSDGRYISGEPAMIFDPTRSDRIGLVGGRRVSDTEYRFWFDAEWRADPGYPSYEPGFPLDLPATPLSPPAVVDVDGDGDLEIVFSDRANRIQVIKPDGEDAPGWPVDVGIALADGPVAVGDLNGDGDPILVVGATDGKAYAYDHEGNLLSGWPSAVTPPGIDIYVSIGAVGSPYQRCVVCAGANYITLRNSRGVNPPGGVGWSTSSNTYQAPAAIGDIDDDGVTEIVAGLGNTVFAYEKGAHVREFIATLPSDLTDALTLGDLDLDGDLEILCPTAGGRLFVLDHDGVQVGGNFPYNSGSSAALTSAAIAQCRGTVQPEIALASLFWTVHLLWHDGDPVNDYPVETSANWFLYGAPIIGNVGEAGMSDVIIGNRGCDAWAWNNSGNRIPGWPKDLGDRINLSPAMGDIDLDGSAEVVMLTDTQLAIVDINSPLNDADEVWAMYGHDPGRTGCSDCPEDLVSQVTPDDLGAITRVSFAGASPNPVSGATQFDFVIPARAAVKLEILDLRGRRIDTVFREEMDAGSRVVTWNGKDRQGDPVASGQYFARLTVRGPGLDDVLTRKVTVIR